VSVRQILDIIIIVPHYPPNQFLSFFLFLNFICLFDREREREQKQGELQAEAEGKAGSLPSRAPNMGLDLRTLGS